MLGDDEVTGLSVRGSIWICIIPPLISTGVHPPPPPPVHPPAVSRQVTPGLDSHPMFHGVQPGEKICREKGRRRRRANKTRVTANLCPANAGKRPAL